MIGRILLALLFLAAGTLHLLDARLFLPIMPPWIPFHRACILISGGCELAGGLGLLFARDRLLVWTGWGLLALLLAVFPANIYMAWANVRVHGIPSSPWIAWVRLPLQPLLMWAVWAVTK